MQGQCRDVISSGPAQVGSLRVLLRQEGVIYYSETVIRSGAQWTRWNRKKSCETRWRISGSREKLRNRNGTVAYLRYLHFGCVSSMLALSDGYFQRMDTHHQIIPVLVEFSISISLPCIRTVLRFSVRLFCARIVRKRAGTLMNYQLCI